MGGLVKSVLRKTRILLSHFPEWIKFPLMRFMLQIQYQLSDEFEIKIADTKEELQAAYSILHDAYVEMDFMHPESNGMRISIYNALPSTTTIITKYKDTVIGTVTVLRESPLGLPLDNDFDVSCVRVNSVNRAEISALCIRKDYRGMSGTVFLTMVKYIYNYCIDYLKVDAIQIATSPRRADFYKALLGFQLVEDRTIEDNYVNGAEMLALYVNIKAGKQHLQKLFFKKKPTKNMFYFLDAFKMKNLKFPKRDFYSVHDPIMTPEMLQYFFCEVTDKFDDLSDFEKNTLHSIYKDLFYKEVLPAANEGLHDEYSRRRSSRFAVFCKANISKVDHGQSSATENIGEDKVDEFTIDEVSMFGFMAKNISYKVEPNVSYLFKIHIGPFELVAVEAQLAWQQESQHAFEIVNTHRQWEEFVTHLFNRVHKTSLVGGDHSEKFHRGEIA